MHRARLTCWRLSLALATWALASATLLAWQAGAARIKITPEQLLWMSGYGARTHAAEGTLIDLWAKALVVEDDRRQRLAIVTLDVVGIDGEFERRVCEELARTYHLERSQIVLSCSHTHSGPFVGKNLVIMREVMLDAEQARLIDQYTAGLERKLLALVGEAIGKLAPATLAFGHGRCDVASNRRNNPEKEVPARRAAGELRGPVDHDVPTLVARGADGKPLAVLCGYACHATVANFYQWSGDYPGFAMLDLEKEHPGAVALFMAGCGGDQNPVPRQKVEYEIEYGKRLATAVKSAMGGAKPINGALDAQFDRVALPFAHVPDANELAKDAQSTNKWEAARAKMYQRELAAGRSLPASYPYPVQVLRLGRELTLVVLGGEVVVDYALRLKQELGEQTTWVAAYSNDVMAYIPSRRVLGEGGYEGATAMVYYGLPSPWTPDVEDLIVNKARALSDRGAKDR